jgi:DNA-binding XRE family transcriptional regulator
MSTSNNCGRKRYGKMARKFSGLEAKMSPASLARSDEKLAKLREEMALNELRVALTITQEHLAKILHVRQAAISKLERRADMYVSTLADFIRAMGGQLEIFAHFPQGKVRITQFQDVKGRPAPEDGEREKDVGAMPHGRGSPPLRDAGQP